MTTENRKLKTENSLSAGNGKRKTQNRLCRVITFGCKVNQCDSAGMSQDLTRAGWLPAAPGMAPDLLLVNTCTVTRRAAQQARQAIRRLARENPGAAIWITGCYAQRAPEELAALPGVKLVLGNQEKIHLAAMLNSSPGRSGAAARAVGEYAAAPPFQPWLVPSLPGHTRTWLKIQEGCSHRCSYCIVPQVRGPRRSWPPAEVAGALQGLADSGCQEVVLTGIDLGQYGQDLAPPGSLAGLVRRLKNYDFPFRVRFSSLEPREISADLLAELASWANFCPHFHLPLQSGAAAVLAAMNRPYRPAAFRDLVLQVARQFPDAALGLDVLAGFPGETVSDFEATRALVASLPVTYLHVFPFSPRPGTPAAELTALPGREVARRASLLRDLGRLKRLTFLETQMQRVREVLVEGRAPRPGWLQGLSDNYLRISFPGPAAWRNRRLKVRLLGHEQESLVGEVVS